MLLVLRRSVRISSWRGPASRDQNPIQPPTSERFWNSASRWFDELLSLDRNDRTLNTAARASADVRAARRSHVTGRRRLL